MKSFTLCLAVLGLVSSANAAKLGNFGGDSVSASSTPGVTQLPGDKMAVTLQKANHWNVNVGPAVSVGLGASNFMYSASGGYVWDFHPRASAKATFEAALGSSSDTARLFNFSVGSNLYILDRGPQQGRPYATADIGVASARNNNNQDNQGLSLGGGVGYEFAPTDKMRLNALVHGSFMATTVGAGNPTVIGARLGVDL